MLCPINYIKKPQLLVGALFESVGFGKTYDAA